MFGNPGSTELPFLANFPKDFEYFLGLHEGSVVGMATGYSLIAETPAVVNLHTTAGTGNAMGAIVTAWHARAPLVITAGQQDRRQISTEPFLWGKQVDFTKSYVKWSVEPHRSVDVPEALERAIQIANASPKGPVFVSIPMDGLDDECPAVEKRHVSGRVAPDPEAIISLGKALSQANRVALIVGEQVDASGAMADVVKLAEKLASPVFLSPLCFRWGFPSNHQLFRGRLPPAMGPLGKILSMFETVLVVGSSAFLYYPYVPGPKIGEGTKLFQITEDPMEASRAVAGTSIVGDVSLAVAQLLNVVEGKSWSPAPRQNKSGDVPKSVPPTAEFVHRRLAEALPSNTVIFAETPSSGQYLRAQISEPKSFFMTPSGSLGFSMPASVGAALATDRPVVCLLGEGSAQYAIQSLWSAATYGGKVTFIVFNNSEYGILKSFAMMYKEEGIPGLELPGIDLEGLAKGYGVDYKKVVDPDKIADTIRQAVAGRELCLIDIPIDRSVKPLLS